MKAFPFFSHCNAMQLHLLTFRCMNSFVISFVNFIASSSYIMLTEFNLRHNTPQISYWSPKRKKCPLYTHVTGIVNINFTSFTLAASPLHVISSSKLLYCNYCSKIIHWSAPNLISLFCYTMSCNILRQN